MNLAALNVLCELVIGHVDQSEVRVFDKGIGGVPEEGGNTDLGSRVSVAAGGYGDNGQALRLYLMEIPIHLYEHGQKMLADVVDNTVAAISAGKTGSGSYQDMVNRYTKGETPKLFSKKT